MTRSTWKGCVGTSKNPEGNILIQTCAFHIPQIVWAYHELSSYISELLRLKGDFANSMYPDAASMRENLDNLQSGEWMNIDLTDEDGEAAAYLQLISDDKVT